jgi:DNA-binding NarL/FixJ family response regulator
MAIMLYWVLSYQKGERNLMKVRLVIADAADLIRLGMEAVLKRQAEFIVEASVSLLTDLWVVAETKPQVIVVDERLDPEIDILQIVEDVLQVSAKTQVLVSGYLRDGLLIRDLFAAGCRGYLYKGDELQESLICAIETVMRDRLYLSPTANAEYLTAMQTPQRDWQLDQEARGVLRLLAQGQHVGQISLALDIHPRRVYWVREKLRVRFGATTNEHMISRAAAEGFIFSS